MTDTLFDMEPTQSADEPTLSADRRRTLRQARDIADGYHPLLTVLHGRGPWSRLHPDAPDDAAPGDRKRPYTCGSCVFRWVVGWHRRAYPKCAWRSDNDRPPPRATHGAATDVRAWWPACPDYSAGEPELSPDATRWIPEADADA